MKLDWSEVYNLQGNLERPFPVQEWYVPAKVWIDKEKLLWTEERGRLLPPEAILDGKLLEGFIKLAEAPARKILAFASKWGPLELCEHDFPANHPATYWPSRPSEGHACIYDVWEHLKSKFPDSSLDFLYAKARAVRKERRERFRDLFPKAPSRDFHFDAFQAFEWAIGQFHKELGLGTIRADFHACYPRGTLHGQAWEPVESWRLWARRARATLTVAANLHSGKIGSEEEWRIAMDTEGVPAKPGFWSMPKRVADGWKELVYHVDYWFRFTGVRAHLAWRHQRAVLTLQGGHLFGTLAAQLALAISRTDGLAICSACSLGYIPHRRPKPDTRHYCPTCRKKGVPIRDAARDYRARKAFSRVRDSEPPQ